MDIIKNIKKLMLKISIEQEKNLNNEKVFNLLANIENDLYEIIEGKFDLEGKIHLNDKQ